MIDSTVTARPFRTRVAVALLTGLTLSTAMASGAEEAVVLAQDGVCRAVIVLAPQATRSAQLAARELQAHIQKICGAAPEVVAPEAATSLTLLPIHVGESEATRAAGLKSDALKPQEQVVRITPQAIFLIGHDTPDYGPISYEQTGAWPGMNVHSPDFEVGTLYAVYDFLERECGVRWYMVGDIGTVAPARPTLRVHTGERRVMPWTTFRAIGSGSWARPGTFGKIDSLGYERNSLVAAGRDCTLHLLRTRARGTDFAFNAHPFHNYHQLYGESHPDWFVDSSPGPSVQLRFWKDEVVNEVVRNVLDYFGRPATPAAPATPEESLRFSGGRGRIFQLGPSDTRLFGADCQPPLQPKRKRPDSFSDGRASDYWFTFVNRVAGRVREVYPDHWISSSSYASHFEPPSFPLEPNVGVYVCNTEGWTADSYGVENLRAWRAKVKRLFVYEYWYAHGKFPAVRPHFLADYIAILRELGVEGWNMEMISAANTSVYHLDYYLNMRLLYDRDADVDALLDEYYRLFYGPAVEPMRCFWETMETTAAGIRDSQLGRIELWAQLAGTNVRQRLAQALDEATKLAVADPYAARVEVIRDGVYAMIEDCIQDAVEQAQTPIPELVVKRARVAAVIDGRLDEPFWQEAATTAPFVHMNNVKPNTEDIAKIAWDGDHLYIGFVLIEPNMDGQVLNKKTSTSGICMDDSVEIFVDVGRRAPTGRDYVQVMVTAAGVSWRYYWGKHLIFAEDMPSLGIETGAWRGSDRWTAELKLPLKPMATLTEGVALPKAGDVWGLGLYRNRQTKFEANVKDRFARGATGWSPTFGAYHVAGRFGKLQFGE